MKQRIQFIFITSSAVLFCIAITLFIIFINLPYYPGFESTLTYLSPDLSGNRTIVRDSFRLPKSSQIKLIFEIKDPSVTYDSSQFYNFLDDLIIQVWNDSEYYEFNKMIISFFGTNSGTVQIPIGSLISKGEYNIYIKSNRGINGSYHIGIGIGRGAMRPKIDRNIRLFY